MNKKTIRIFLAMTLALTFLAGCGSSAATSKEAGAYGEYREPPEIMGDAYYDEEAVAMSDDVYATEESYEMEAEEATGSSSAEILNEDANAQGSSRKLIKNVNLNVETEEFDKFMVNVEQKVNALGGYIESSEISGRSLYNTSANRYASVTARVPNDKLDSFITTITEQSNITSKTVSTEDVTLMYADTQAHIESLKSEQKRLQDLITQADDLDTLLTLEARLTEVSYEIESYERQLRSMDNRVDYSTIYIYVEEVTHYTPVEEEPLTAGERISRGLSENLYQIGNGFKEFGIGFVIGLPYIILTLLIIGLIALVIWLIVRAIIKASRKSAEKNRALQMQRAQNAAAQRPVTPVKPAPAKPATAKPAEQTQENKQDNK